MTFIRYLIPGLLWFNLLNTIRDDCCYPILGSYCLCEILVAMTWIYTLNKLRLQVNDVVKYYKYKYYIPKKDQYHQLWSNHWILRFVICCVTFSGSYYCLLLRSTAVTATSSSGNGDEQRISHRIVQGFINQADTITWLLGTLLRIEQHLFVPLVILVNVLSPLCGILTMWCGSFALWLVLGASLQQVFDLSPHEHPTNLGMRGATLGAIVSSIYCNPYGIQETTVALTFAIVGELLYRTIFPCNRKEQDNGTSPMGKDGNNKQAVVSTSTPKVTTRTRPSLNIWFALLAFWIGLGIALDSHHYHSYDPTS